MLHLYTRSFHAPENPKDATAFFQFFYQRYLHGIFTFEQVQRAKCMEEVHLNPSRPPGSGQHVYYFLLKDEIPFENFLEQQIDTHPEIETLQDELQRWFEQPGVIQDNDNIADDYSMEFTYANTSGYNAFRDRPAICILTEVKHEHVKEFETWYREDYIPNFLALVPHIEVCRRFRSWRNDPPRFFTSYGITDETRFETVDQFMTRPYCANHLQKWCEMKDKCLTRHEIVRLRSSYLRARDQKP